MSVVYSFGLHDQLPTVYDIVSTIYTLAPGGSPDEKKETELRKSVVHHYALELECLWQKLLQLHMFYL